MMLTDSLKVLVYAFDNYGKPIYEAFTDGGRKWYDATACTCDNYLKQDDEEDDRVATKRKSSQQSLQAKYEMNDSSMDLLGEP